MNFLNQFLNSDRDFFFQHFAIKVVDKQNLINEDLENLDNEISLLALLESPYIIKFFEKVECNHYIYIVNELCNGGDLENVLD